MAPPRGPTVCDSEVSHIDVTWPPHCVLDHRSPHCMGTMRGYPKYLQPPHSPCDRTNSQCTEGISVTLATEVIIKDCSIFVPWPLPNRGCRRDTVVLPVHQRHHLRSPSTTLRLTLTFVLWALTPPLRNLGPHSAAGSGSPDAFDKRYKPIQLLLLWIQESCINPYQVLPDVCMCTCSTVWLTFVITWLTSDEPNGHPEMAVFLASTQETHQSTTNLKNDGQDTIAGACYVYLSWHIYSTLKLKPAQTATCPQQRSLLGLTRR